MTILGADARAKSMQADWNVCRSAMGLLSALREQRADA